MSDGSPSNSTPTRLRILSLEDDPHDAELIQATLRTAGLAFDFHHVDTEAGFVAALDAGGFDVVLADYSLPGTDGGVALQLCRERQPEWPFVFVTGSLGEELAIETLKRGAADYVLKDNLVRLPRAVERAVREAKERTARRAAEQALRASEERMRLFFERQVVGMAITSPEKGWLQVNDRLCEMLGYSREELTGTTWAELTYPEDLAADVVQFNRLLAGDINDYVLEKRFVRKDGNLLYTNLAVACVRRPDGSVDYVLAVLEDITQRKKVEESLSRRAAFDAIITRILAGFASCAAEEVDGCIRASLEEMARFVGVDSAVIALFSPDHATWSMAHNWAAPGIPDVTPRYQHVPMGTSNWAAVKLLAGEAVVINSIDEIPPEADIERRSFEQDGMKSRFALPLRGRGGRIIGAIGFRSYSRQVTWIADDLHQLRMVSDAIANVLERKQAEASLNESEQRFRDLFERSPDAVFVEDPSGRILDANPAACRLHGLDRGALVGKNVLETVPPELREKVSREFPKWLSGELTQSEGISLTADGRHVPVEIRGACIQYGDRSAVLLHVRDISERRQAEVERQALQAQLIQAQKMEAVGQLAGGVAHDFNNILTAVLMHLSLLQSEEGLSAEVRAGLAELATEANRAANLTRQLLMFSRRQALQREVLDLNSLLGNFLKMLRRLIGEHIGLEFKGAPHALWMEADPGMLEQVVMNLVVNARDAMPNGGRITLATRLAEFDERVRDRQPEAAPGQFVGLSVTDTGCGMDAAVLKHIFEPFFTTKEVGKGTGLGLATVYGIVKQHGGWVEIESAVGQGSTFSIYLPAKAQVFAISTQGSGIKAVKGGNETLLLVEDEPSVRQTANAVLRQHGYQLFEAGDGPAALQVWQQCGGKVDLLLTDMVMPGGLSGLELAEHLLAQNARLKVILMSGYSTEMAGRDVPKREGVTFLQKPFVASTLARLVRDCLDAK